MGLAVYNKKRNFKNTPEPKGRSGLKNHFRFVVQRHDASRLHYDFRLELGGVLKSWAVPKGPSMNPADKRLAVQVEDHPVSYIHFEGVIPEGNYGAGTVAVWDKGIFFAVNENLEKLTERQAVKALENGELKFFLRGDKLEGGFVLVKMKTAGEKNWLLIKHKDEWAVNKKYDSENITKASLSKRSRRTSLEKKTAKKKIQDAGQ
jgi:bifunctional non-homologous end joining protein LigD